MIRRPPRSTRSEFYSPTIRIEAEELALDSSEIIITSTRQEIEEQWSLYHGFDVILQRKLRARIKRGVNCYGRYMPRMFVVPPGMEFNNIGMQVVDVDGDIEGREDNPGSPDPPPIWSEIMRFFSNPRKPQILALARPDPKKNIMTLVKAFGECRPLRELANLTLIMGNRETIDDMSSTSASVLTSVLKLIDKYDMYGQVAYPKHHKQSDVPDIYRLAARTKGVFINPAFIEPFGLTLIEAAAYGLPMVATKNGGPVDIHKVLDNGLLVHPHNQQDISDALLKLVSDKQLWTRCHKNGLKNIHLFSWPEHCKSYLSRIASCKSRHPQWRRSDDIIEGSDSDSPSNSLRDIQDISLNLKLSLDGEKTEESGSLDFEENPTDGKSKLESAFLKLSKTVRSTQKIGSNDKNDSSKFPMLRRRKHIFVIALDCDTDKDLIKNIQKIFEAVHKDRTLGSIGFILSTSLTISETHSVIISSGLAVTDFDAFICNSGSDLYYPSANLDDIVGRPSELPFAVDLDYHSQIEYRWGGEGLRKTFVRWAAGIVEKKGESEDQVVTEDEQRSSRYCLSFNVKTPGMVPPIKELRKLMRIQALRCHILHSHDGTKLHVIPVLASRSQALRYLYVRWGTDLTSVVVFVGESGATDYEGLLGGVHKTVVLKGVCGNIPDHLRSARDYPLEDVVVFERPNIVQTENVSSVDEVRSALSKLGVL